MTIECDDTDHGGAQDGTRYEVEAGEPPSIAVVRAVAAASGRNPVATDGLDPLAQTIDPEALDRIFGSGSGTSEDATLVEFRYGGHQVTVKGTDAVCVTVE